MPSPIRKSATRYTSKSRGWSPRATTINQFTIGGERSRIGRSRTLPPAGAAVSQLRVAVAGCQRYEAGYFTAFRHLAAERFDLVFHYGDYIYEYRVVRPGELAYPVVRVMPGEPDECYTLDDYRHRYALHQLDPDLQAAHASAPFVMSFDYHEVDNDFAGANNQDGAPSELSCCGAPPPFRHGTSTCRSGARKSRAVPTSWPIAGSPSATCST